MRLWAKFQSLIAIAAIAALAACTNPTSAPPNSELVAERFEAAKASRPQLIKFLKDMPKGADLHNHLDGTIYNETLLAYAINAGMRYNTSTQSFTTAPPGGVVIPIDQLKYNDELFRAYREAYSVRAYEEQGGSGRDQFFSVFPRINASGIPDADVLAGIIATSLDQNIQHQEIISPVTPPRVRALFDNALRGVDVMDLDAAFAAIEPLLSRADVMQAYRDQIDLWETTAFDQLGLTKSEAGLSVRYTGYIIRIGDMTSYYIDVATGLAAISADPRITSLTIVAPEDHPDASLYFDQHMAIIDYLWRRMGEPKMTLHAGELTIRDATLKSMKSRIRDSIEIGHASRIGHGVSIAWEDNVDELLTFMADQGILVEICLTSNEVILGVKGEAHPFALYREYGVPISLNTDDEGITRNPLTIEFVKAVERYDLSYRDVLELARNSLEYSFLEGESLFNDRDFTKMRKPFRDIYNAAWAPSSAAQTLIDNNPKLSVQVAFETALAEFERAQVDPSS